MDKGTPSDRPTGAEQRMRRQQAEGQQRIVRQPPPSPVGREGPPVRAEERPMGQHPRQRPAGYPVGGRPGGGAPPHPGGPRPPYPPESYHHQDDGGQAPPPRGGRKGPRNRWFIAMIMVATTLAACLFLSLFLVQSAFDLLGINQEDNVIAVTIPQGAGVADVVRILGEAEVVNHPLAFRFYLNFRSVQDDSLLPGDYIFNSRMSYDELIRALMTGRTVREVVRLTFIEGWTLWEFALHLEEHGVVDAEEFIEYLNTADFGFEFFGMIEPSPLRLHMLEGYLFPDTYDFYVGENVSSVARKFLRNFNNQVMTPQLLTRMDQLNLSVDETITLASIIQREAGLADDMRLVSSVFHNRLNSPNFPRLESDVTWFYIRLSILPRFFPELDPDADTQYILENIMPYLTASQRDLIEAYDTYLTEGLPIGPVSNPGMDAILAALHPENTSFFFFVTDVNGDFYYAATYARHRENIALALAVGDEVRGIDTPTYQQ